MPEPPSRQKCESKLKTATDNSEAMESDKKIEHDIAKDTRSRSLGGCERMKRRKLNEKLLSLRAVVPTNTKLDQASIVADAIGYVQQLQMEVQDMEKDVLSLQIDKHTLFENKDVDDCSSCCADRSTDAETFWHNDPIQRVLELNVSKLGKNLYHLKVCCKNGPDILVQLTKVLEILNLNIINANIASMGNQVVKTTVFKISNSDELLTPTELEDRIVETLHMLGFHF